MKQVATGGHIELRHRGHRRYSAAIVSLEAVTAASSSFAQQLCMATVRAFVLYGSEVPSPHVHTHAPTPAFTLHDQRGLRGASIRIACAERASTKTAVGCI